MLLSTMPKSRRVMLTVLSLLLLIALIGNIVPGLHQKATSAFLRQVESRKTSQSGDPLRRIHFAAEHGLNKSLEIVETTLHVQFPEMSRTGSRLDVMVQSRRKPCNYGGCLYRVYLDGPARMGKYLRENHTVYATHFDIFEPGTYRILVLLESLTNNTNTLDLAPEAGSGAISFSESKGLCLGERITRTDATVSVGFEETYLPPYHYNSSLYSASLPRCEYGIEDLHHNKFEWVHRRTLESHGFSPKDTGIIPLAYLPGPNHDAKPTNQTTQALTNGWKEHPEWIQPSQEYVWHPRTCVQPWIERQAIEELVQKLGGLQIWMVGTSRVLHTSQMMNEYLKRRPSETSKLAIKYHWRLSPELSNITKKKGPASDEATRICPKELANATEASSAVAIVVSYGIWEATFHNIISHPERAAPFRFMENANAMIKNVLEKCKGRQFKLILMTQPTSHLFDARDGDPYVARNTFVTDKSFTSGEKSALRNARIDVVNHAFKALAAKYNLPIVDGEGISFSRFDSVWDTTHYRLEHNHSIGNEVTMTFVQHIMAAILQAFEMK